MRLGAALMVKLQTMLDCDRLAGSAALRRIASQTLPQGRWIDSPDAAYWIKSLRLPSHPASSLGCHNLKRYRDS
jgi:hypothetical protein